MSRRKQLFWIYLLAVPVVLVLVLLLGVLITESATAYASECQTCHDQLASITAMRQCEACHQGSDIHLILSRDKDLYHENHYEEEICYSYHNCLCDTDKIVDFRKTLDGGLGDGTMPVKGWSITSDLPNWNALIDERLLILGNHN